MNDQEIFKNKSCVLSNTTYTYGFESFVLFFGPAQYLHFFFDAFVLPIVCGKVIPAKLSW